MCLGAAKHFLFFIFFFFLHKQLLHPESSGMLVHNHSIVRNVVYKRKIIKFVRRDCKDFYIFTEISSFSFIQTFLSSRNREKLYHGFTFLYQKNIKHTGRKTGAPDKHIRKSSEGKRCVTLN